MIRSNNETAYDCKVLATYHDAASYKVSAKYTVVVRIIDLKTNTSINLSPDGFYNAEQYAKSGKTIGYYFSGIEVKSEWTYNQHKKVNLLKEQACLKQGHNFEFKIIKK